MAGFERLREKLDPPSMQDVDIRQDEELFQEAMEGVRQLKTQRRIARRNGPTAPLGTRDEFSEGRQLLQDFVAGKIEFEWSFHPGYQEGGSEAGNRQLVRKLRRGAYSVQRELDLHGMTQTEALVALEAFLQECSARNIRCVRIVHGKGNNSQNNLGVLKQKLPQWLATKRMARLVIAFTSARPADGGLGATYILLRKSPLTEGRIRN